MPCEVPVARRHAAHLARPRPDQPRRPGDPARLACVRALLDPRRRDDLGDAAASRPREGREGIPRSGTRRYQFANGKVPCCVDRRGADPVPENDSAGEFLFLHRQRLSLHRRRRAAAAAVAGDGQSGRLHGQAAPVGAHRSEPAGRSQGVLRPDACLDQPRGLLGETHAFVLGRLLGAGRLRVGDPDRAGARSEDRDARASSKRATSSGATCMCR